MWEVYASIVSWMGNGVACNIFMASVSRGVGELELC